MIKLKPILCLLIYPGWSWLQKLISCRKTSNNVLKYIFLFFFKFWRHLANRHAHDASSLQFSSNMPLRTYEVCVLEKVKSLCCQIELQAEHKLHLSFQSESFTSDHSSSSNLTLQTRQTKRRVFLRRNKKSCAQWRASQQAVV